MKKSQWKQGWAALRALGYWRTVQCYGMETAEAASVCFLKRAEALAGEFYWRKQAKRAREVIE